MNKTIILFFGALLLMSCKQPITLISAVKQTIIPGRPNIEKYNNYVVNFSLEENASLVIDSVKVFEDAKSYTANFTLKKKGAASYIKHLNEKGNYTLEVPLRNKNKMKSNLETAAQNKLILFYSENKEMKQLVVSKFETKTVTKR